MHNVIWLIGFIHVRCKFKHSYCFATLFNVFLNLHCGIVLLTRYQMMMAYVLIF